jgi:hypothetical protein
MQRPRISGCQTVDSRAAIRSLANTSRSEPPAWSRLSRERDVPAIGPQVSLVSVLDPFGDAYIIFPRHAVPFCSGRSCDRCRNSMHTRRVMSRGDVGTLSMVRHPCRKTRGEFPVMSSACLADRMPRAERAGPRARMPLLLPQTGRKFPCFHGGEGRPSVLAAHNLFSPVVLLFFY